MKTDGYIMGGGCVTPKSIAFAEMLPSDIPEQCVGPRIEKVESYELSDGNTLLICVVSGDPLPSAHWFGIHANGKQVLLVTVEPPQDKASPWTGASVLVSHAETEFVKYECKANTTLAQSVASQGFLQITTPVPTRHFHTLVPVTTEGSIMPVSPEDRNSQKKYTAGEMAGAVLGTLIICLLLVGFVLFVIWTRTRRDQVSAQLSGRQELELQDIPFDVNADRNSKRGFSFKVSFQELKPRISKQSDKLSTTASDTFSLGVKGNDPASPRDQERTPGDNGDSDEMKYDSTEPQGDYVYLNNTDSTDSNSDMYEPLDDVRSDYMRTPNRMGAEIRDGGPHPDDKKREMEQPACSTGAPILETADTCYNDVEIRTDNTRQPGRSMVGSTTGSDEEDDADPIYQNQESDDDDASREACAAGIDVANKSWNGQAPALSTNTSSQRDSVGSDLLEKVYDEVRNSQFVE